MQVKDKSRLLKRIICLFKGHEYSDGYKYNFKGDYYEGKIKYKFCQRCGKEVL